MLVLDPVPRHVWQGFVEGAEVAAGPARSWSRVRALGADPHGVRDAVHCALELTARRERHGALRIAAGATLEAATDALAARDVSVLLCDADGVVLDAWAGGAFVTEARRVGLVPGSDWGEALRGTNAIGTALAEAQAVTVRGTAHWAQANHGLVCYASPLRGADGRIVGVLDATTFAGGHDPAVAAALLAAARGLEARLFAGDPATRALAALVERMQEVAVLVDAAGRAVVASAAGVRALAALGRTSLPVGAVQAALVAGRAVPLPGALGWQLRAEPLGPDGLLHLVVLAETRRAPRLPDPPRAPGVRRDERVAERLVRDVPPTSRAPRRRLPDPFDAVAGSDPRVARLRDEARRFARTDLPVLLLSETGTGKEVLARALHAGSTRANAAFVAVNCGALAPTLLESELFGYAPGAFTGALRGGRDGRVAAAHGGTLLLDEIGEMPPPLQAMLLRFLEDGSYTRVGESAERHADVRLIAATCRDLPRLVEEGRFRADLYYRIRVVRLGLPPLRERTDLADLARALLAELAGPLASPTLTPEALACLLAHRWPGNVREIKNALRYALVAADGDVIGPEHLPDDLRAPVTPPAGGASLAAVEIDAVKAALAAARGNVAAAARKLGVARSTIYRMLERARG
ncbi:MAG: sigma 54-interacting transcriptional regulator [Pseudomonadota bacterium]|nr:sigma 54-interacting transcriptional regulator [Pseudomonadota bacterium]